MQTDYRLFNSLNLIRAEFSYSSSNNTTVFEIFNLVNHEIESLNQIFAGLQIFTKAGKDIF